MTRPLGTPCKSSRNVRRDAYRETAERVGGRLMKGKGTGGLSVEAEHAGWTLTLGIHPVQMGTAVVLHTRVLVYFTGRERLRLSVRPRRLLDRAAARLGFRGLNVAGRDFGERFVVRGRPPPRVRSVLSAGLGAAVAAEGPLKVSVRRASWWQRRKQGPRAHQLEVLIAKADVDVDVMVGMFRVAREGIDAMVRVGIASA